jgi:hypothetical protein
MVFQYFQNATMTVTRSQGTRGPQGYTEDSSNQIFSGRCDAQLSGKSLERKRDLHEETDAVVFIGETSDIQPGDSADIAIDDGPTRSGTVVSVSRIDHSVLVSL